MGHIIGGYRYGQSIGIPKFVPKNFDPVLVTLISHNPSTCDLADSNKQSNEKNLSHHTNISESCGIFTFKMH